MRAGGRSRMKRTRQRRVQKLAPRLRALIRDGAFQTNRFANDHEMQTV